MCFDVVIIIAGRVWFYCGICAVFQGATGKAKECLKLQEEGKMTEPETQKVLGRTDVISYGTLAEMNHFQSERVKDFKLMMQLYLRSQIKFYQEVSTVSYILRIENCQETNVCP